MTAGSSIAPAFVKTLDPSAFLHDQLEQTSPDLMRQLPTTFLNAMLCAEPDQVFGAAYNNRSPERVNSRNGYRHRDFDTRVGTV